MAIDPDQFLSGTIQGANSTMLIPVPEGEYRASVTDVVLRSFTYSKGERSGQTGYALDLTWDIMDEGVKSIIKRDPKVRQSMMLDLNGEALDMGEGRNVSLGKLRAAVKQNQAGTPWAPSMLKGAVAVILTKNTMDGENIYSNVIRVAAA